MTELDEMMWFVSPISLSLPPPFSPQGLMFLVASLLFFLLF